MKLSTCASVCLILNADESLIVLQCPMPNKSFRHAHKYILQVAVVVAQLPSVSSDIVITLYTPEFINPKSAAAEHAGQKHSQQASLLDLHINCAVITWKLTLNIFDVAWCQFQVSSWVELSASMLCEQLAQSCLWTYESLLRTCRNEACMKSSKAFKMNPMGWSSLTKSCLLCRVWIDWLSWFLGPDAINAENTQDSRLGTVWKSLNIAKGSKLLRRDRGISTFFPFTNSRLDQVQAHWQWWFGPRLTTSFALVVLSGRLARSQRRKLAYLIMQ